jgi:hypothetical protein
MPDLDQIKQEEQERDGRGRFPKGWSGNRGPARAAVPRAVAPLCA